MPKSPPPPSSPAPPGSTATPGLRAVTGGVTVDVLASAGASVSKVRGWHGAELKIAVRAAPEKGKANAEIEALLAECFDVAKNQVAVIAGQTSRHKRVQITGIDIPTVQAKMRAIT